MVMGLKVCDLVRVMVWAWARVRVLSLKTFWEMRE